MISRKQLIFAIIVVVIGGIVFFSIILSGNKPKTSEPAPSSSPVGIPVISVPQELKQEQTSQENYGQIRKQYLEENPWILSMPLQSENYFISYDSEKDEFLISLYYWRASSLSREEQINQAKNEALDALKGLGLESDKIKAVYSETGRN